MDDVGGLRGQPGEVSAGEGRIRVGRPAPFIAQVPQGVGVLDVVDLIEHERSGVVESDEAQQRGDEADDAGDDPPARPHAEGQHGPHRAQPEQGAQLVLSALDDDGLCWCRARGLGRFLGGLGQCGVRGLIPP